jgi:hypothetical protein
MILQQIIFNAVMQGLKAIGIGAPVAHTGGVIGSSALPQPQRLPDVVRERAALPRRRHRRPEAR